MVLAKGNLIIIEFRLPRIVLTILVGIGMGTSGCVMQSLLRNDMASPGTFGNKFWFRVICFIVCGYF